MISSVLTLFLYDLFIFRSVSNVFKYFKDIFTISSPLPISSVVLLDNIDEFFIHPSKCSSSYRYVVSAIIGLFDDELVRSRYHVVASFTDRTRLHPSLLQTYRFHDPIIIPSPNTLIREEIYADYIISLLPLISHLNDADMNARCKGLAKHMSLMSQGYSYANLHDVIQNVQTDMDIRLFIKGLQTSFVYVV